MAILPIRIHPDPVLRGPTKEVHDFDANLARLLGDLEETMRDAPGTGLAAPQVGIQRRIAIYDAGDGVLELMNPKIVSRFGEQRGEEGCLSIPGIYFDVTRSFEVKIVAQDRHGDPFELEAEEFEAVVIQHEIDHLEGVLFIDLLEPEDQKLAKKLILEGLVTGSVLPNRATI